MTKDLSQQNTQFSLDFVDDGFSFHEIERYTVYLASPITQLPPEAKLELHEISACVRAVLGETGADVYSPREITAVGSPHSCDEVYTIDHHRCASADLVFLWCQGHRLELVSRPRFRPHVPFRES